MKGNQKRLGEIAFKVKFNLELFSNSSHLCDHLSHTSTSAEELFFLKISHGSTMSQWAGMAFGIHN